jgi:dihydrofolate reductase
MEAILAVDINNGLSKDGIIPWRSKNDMQFFLNKTKNNIVIMGKNT